MEDQPVPYDPAGRLWKRAREGIFDAPLPPPPRCDNAELRRARRHIRVLEAALRLSESKLRLQEKRSMLLLTRYEMARVVGLRAVALDEGAAPLVRVDDPRLSCDAVYVAACELWQRKLDAKIMRDDVEVHLRTVRFPPELAALLDTKDGGTRGLLNRTPESPSLA